jgi:hypothetical protein
VTEALWSYGVAELYERCRHYDMAIMLQELMRPEGNYQIRKFKKEGKEAVKYEDIVQ